jgi:hypothetical protein
MKYVFKLKGTHSEILNFKLRDQNNVHLNRSRSKNGYYRVFKKFNPIIGPLLPKVLLQW